MGRSTEQRLREEKAPGYQLTVIRHGESLSFDRLSFVLFVQAEFAAAGVSCR